MSYNWTMLFEEYAGELDPTFKKELSSQLFAKGSLTGIKNFEKYNFQLMVGMRPLDIEIKDNKAFATIEFITPTSWSLPTRISWTVKIKNDSLELLHTTEVNKDLIEFNWEDDFPLETVKEHLTPYKKTKGTKNGLGFDVEYFYLLIPDVELEIFTEKELTTETLDELDDYIQSYKTAWNNEKKGKEIEFISNITRNKGYYSLIMDIGLKNSIRTINIFLKKLSEKYDENISLIKVK